MKCEHCGGKVKNGKCADCGYKAEKPTGKKAAPVVKGKEKGKKPFPFQKKK